MQNMPDEAVLICYCIRVSLESLNVEKRIVVVYCLWYLCYRAGNVHARGHGLQSLGDMNQDELERKRSKTLEHQVINLEIRNSVLKLTS